MLEEWGECREGGLGTQKASEADGWCEELLRRPPGFSSLCHDEYAVVFIQQSTLCQATLSIGLYLLLEGPVPT
jgi:hypothetical protein